MIVRNANKIFEVKCSKGHAMFYHSPNIEPESIFFRFSNYVIASDRYKEEKTPKYCQRCFHDMVAENCGVLGEEVEVYRSE